MIQNLEQLVIGILRLNGIIKLTTKMSVTLVILISVTSSVSIADTVFDSLLVPNVITDSRLDETCQYDYRQIGRINVSFEPTDVRIKSEISPRALNIALEGTGLNGLGEAYVNAENQSGVNAVFIVAITVLESGWGESRLAKEKFNVSGFTAYDSNPYHFATSFDSLDECIMVTGETLRETYVLNDLTSVYNIGHVYASDEQWASKIVDIVSTIERRINDYEGGKYD